MVDARNSATGVRIHNSRAKRESRFRLTGRQVFLILVMLLAFMLSGIGYVWSNFERTQMGYELSRLKKEELKLIEINRKLRLELAHLKSPADLEAKAVKRLGLRQPTAQQIVILP
jgi:cell division protein FtsL